MTKPTLDDKRRSAGFCGHDVKILKTGTYFMDSIGFPKEEWNPPENAEQDRQLLHKLLDAGYDVMYCSDDDIGVIYAPQEDGRRKGIIHLQCDRNDFLTLAASKVQEMQMEVSNIDAAIDKAATVPSHFDNQKAPK